MRATAAPSTAASSTSRTASVLYLEDITVSFDGFKALNNLSLTIDAGELRCVIGPNGAGKTTMMDVITGKTRPDAGTRVLRPDHRPDAPDRSRRSRTPASGASSRSPRSSSTTRVFENLELAMKADKRVRRTLFAQARRRGARSHRRDARAHPPCRRAPTAPAGLLSHGQKQWLEIGMLLMQEPQPAAARRARRGHERRGDRAHRGAVPVAGGQAFAGRGRARHGVRRAHRAQGHGAARGQRARRRARWTRCRTIRA